MAAAIALQIVALGGGFASATVPTLFGKDATVIFWTSVAAMLIGFGAAASLVIIGARDAPEIARKPHITIGKAHSVILENNTVKSTKPFLDAGKISALRVIGNLFKDN